MKDAPRNRRGDIMYVRFVTPLIDPDSRVESGFFRAEWHIEECGAPDWLRRELNDQRDWFRRNLAVPERITCYRGHRGVRHGVCWFRDSARECIERARYCAWLISEAGLPVAEISMPRSCEILWGDAHQVVVPSWAVRIRAFARC